MKLSIFYKKPLFSLGLIGLICLSNPLKAMDEPENKRYPVKFAVIGDYGTQSEGSKKVSSLVKSWDPDFIITTGDNNYPSGAAETIDDNIGACYSQFIYPYKGKYNKPTVTHNRFWPCLGNHDFGPNKDARPYFDYLPALNNQFYYDFVKGPLHFFSVCSDRRCPDGIFPNSTQMLWLKDKIKASQHSWKIVYYHHPTYSSRVWSPGGGGWPAEDRKKNSERKIDLPFSEWGVSAVLSGHLHLYERFDIMGVPYIINGLGGDEGYYKFSDDVPDPESIVRFAGEDGAMFIKANDKEVSFKFKTTSGRTVDKFSLKK